MKICKYFALFFLVSGVLGAQEAQWRLVQANGACSYRAGGNPGSVIPANGVNLNRGDLVQTGRGGAELQLLPPGASPGADYTRLKLGENTSLQIGSLASLELLYGRVRVDTGTLSGRPVSISGGSSMVEFRQTDSGVDYYIPSENADSAQPGFAVHAFSGSGEITPLKDGITDVTSLTVNAGETVRAEFHSPLSFVERKPIESEAQDYWSSRGFSGITPPAVPLAPAVIAAAPEPEAPPESAPEPKQEKTDPKAIHNQKVSGAVGLFFNLAGVAMLSAAEYAPDSFKLGDIARENLYKGGFVPIGLGSSFYLSLALDKTKSASPEPETGDAKVIKNRRTAFGLGFFFTAAGAAMLGAAHYGKDFFKLSDDAQKILKTAGYIPVGFGSTLVLSVLLSDP